MAIYFNPHTVNFANHQHLTDRSMAETTINSDNIVSEYQASTATGHATMQTKR